MLGIVVVCVVSTVVFTLHFHGEQHVQESRENPHRQITAHSLTHHTHPRDAIPPQRERKVTNILKEYEVTRQ